MSFRRFVVMVGILLALMHLSGLPAEVSADAERFQFTLTLLYSGNERGMLEALGCDAQVGGLDRRYTLLQSLRDQHPNALNLHVGNILGALDANSEVVYQVALEALALMQVDALTLGPSDLCLPVETLKALHANRPEVPVVCANVETDNRLWPQVLAFTPYIVREVSLGSGKSVKVAVVGLLSNAYEAEIQAQASNPDVRVAPPEAVLQHLQPELTRDGSLVVGVLHGTLDEARSLAGTCPWVNVLLPSGEQAQNVPRATFNVPEGEPTRVGQTLVVTNAPRGESVGVLELGFDADLQVVSKQHRFLPVSEALAPSEEVTLLLDVVERLEEEAWNAERQGGEGVGTWGSESLSHFPPSSLTHSPSTPHSEVHLVYFYKRGCEKCARADKLLRELQERYPPLTIDRRNVKEHQPLLEAMGQLYGVPDVKRLTTPAVFIGNEYFLGELDGTAERNESAEFRVRSAEETPSFPHSALHIPHSPLTLDPSPSSPSLEAVIQHYLPTGVASCLPQAEDRTTEASSDIVSRFRSLGAVTVAGAGLLDGINPCAFATLVFFISYLSLVGRSRKEMLLAGLAFASAVFVTYLLLGLGVLKFLDAVRSLAMVSRCVYLAAGIATLGLALVSFYDAYQAKRGKAKDIKLQLPKSLKLRIHRVIRERTRRSGILVGALGIGFAISALELVCTGQVYLPTLTFVTGVPGMRLHAFSYLLLYNGMFVVPLLIVFGFVYWGTTSIQLGGALHRHLMTVKLGTGMLLLGLGSWLLMGFV